MVKRSETTGSGITERTVERETFELPQGVDEHNLTAGSMDQGKAAFEAMRRTNARARLPWAHKQRVIDYAREQVRALTGYDGSPGTLPKNKFRAYADVDWYWIEIVRCAARAEQMATNGNLGIALDLALTVGLYLKELEMKIDWEGPALVGQKCLKGAAHAGANLRKESDEVRHAEAQKHIDAGASKKEAFSLAANQLLGSPLSVKRSYYLVHNAKK